MKVTKFKSISKCKLFTLHTSEIKWCTNKINVSNLPSDVLKYSN